MRLEIEGQIQEAIRANAEEIDVLRSRIGELEADQERLLNALKALTPAVSPSADREESSVDNHTGKYRKLWEYLRAQRTDRITMSFTEIENEVLGFRLPASSRNHLPHWYGYGGSAVARAIQDAGWKASNVNLSRESVVFVRQ